MKRKILSIFLCSLMLTGGVCGCSKDESTVDTSPSSSTVEETGYKTMEPPEDGWTIEELLSVTYICDNQLSYPLTMDLLENNVEIFEDTLKVRNAKDTPSVMAELCSDNEFMGAAFFNRDSVNDISGDTPINIIYFSYHSDFFKKNGSPIVLNGVALGDSKEDLIKALGDDVVIDDNIVKYVFNEEQKSEVLFGCDEDDGTFRSVKFNNLEKASKNHE